MGVLAADRLAMVTSGTLRIQVRLLGLVEVSLDGRPVALGGSKQRALLALLALNVNAPVATDQLIEGLWGEFAPPSAAKMVQLYVSQVRRLLDGGDGEIVTRGRGYELRLPADAVDAVRFERLVAEASGADDRASAVAGEALALWRGRPLDDIADQPFAAAEIRRLDEQWLHARELAIDGALAAGGHRNVLSELDDLVAAHPLREGIHAQRMLALYRSGRQADALEAYRHARGVLVREAGVEPGPELRRLHAAILDQDPSLDLPASRSAPAPLAWASARGRRAVALVAALFVAAALAALVVVASSSDSSPPTVPANAVAIIDPAKDAVAGSIALDEGPGPIAASGGGLTVLNLNSQSLAHIDADSRRIVATAGVGGSPGSLAVTADDLWVTKHCGEGSAGSVFRYVMWTDGAINLTDAEEISLAGIAGASGPIPQQTGPGCGMAANAKSVWVATSLPPGLARIDVDPSGVARVARAARLRFVPEAIALAWGSLWIPENERNRVVRIDPDTLARVRLIDAGDDPVAVASGLGAVWVANYGDGSVSRVDPGTNSVTKAISVGENPIALAVGQDSVWVANSGDGSVSRIDPRTNGVTATVAVGHRPQGIAIAGGAVWVTVRS
jgi:YVTN family beta-propeller protein